MESEADPRERDVVALLKQLSSGLSAYRLYPGNLEQLAFTSAVERIRAAAEDALSGGTVTVEIQGDRFHMAGPLPDDEALRRLARACYDRGTDRIRIRSVPEAQELATIYEILTEKPTDVAAAGGVEEMISGTGVASISMSQVKLVASEHQIPDGLSEEQAVMWERLQQGDDLMDYEPVEDVAETADSLYGRFRELVAALPDEVAEDPELYRRLQGAVARVPDETRKALSSRMMHHLADDVVAQRLIGTMTDADLARTVAEVARADGENALELAQSLVNSGFRRDNNVVHMTEAALLGTQEAGTIIPAVFAAHSGKIGGQGATGGEGAAGTSSEGRATKLAPPEEPTIGGLVPVPGLDYVKPRDPAPASRSRSRRRKGSMLIDASSSAAAPQGLSGALAATAMSAPTQAQMPKPAGVSETVSDLLGRELLASADEDSRAILAEFPATADDHHELALQVLEDYLGLEEETERLEKVLEIWSTEARDALRRGDLDTALRLVTIARQAGARSIERDQGVEALFKVYKRRVLDARLLRDMITPGREQSRLFEILTPFGSDAVDALLDLLGDEEDRAKRASLINILSRFARDYPENVIERLGSPRWYLVRNAVLILCRAGVAKDVLSELEGLTRHEHPAVRREALR
ncbi:MAG: hypothetical protein M3238_03955, partial [Actinomycetota bacterium]|nr:hypothetical protein [Actinomycetota bacterium]